MEYLEKNFPQEVLEEQHEDNMMEMPFKQKFIESHRFHLFF